MPIVFRAHGFRFHFYSDEGDPREPVHIHVARPGEDAKFWLRPEVQIAYNRGMKTNDINRVRRTIEERADEIERIWHEHFSTRD